VGLPARRLRDVRRRAPQLLRVAAPSVRERAERRAAALLHVHDRADLDPDRAHLPERDGHALARAYPLHGADALRARVLLQLPDRRALWDLPVRRPERRDHARLVLRDGALPLHDHGRPRLRVLRGDVLLAAEDDGRPARRAAREDPLLDDVRLLQPDVLPALRGRLPRHAAARLDVCAEPADAERLRVRLGVLPRRVDARLRREPRPLARLSSRPVAPEPVARTRARVARADAGARRQLRRDSDRHGRPLRLRPAGRAAGGHARMSTVDPPVVQIPIEAPDLEARIVSVGAYLAAAAIAFFFMTFLFAFFYLRALDTNGLWGAGKPHHHVHPAMTVGIVVLVCVLASVALVRASLVGLRTRRIHARGAGLVALVLGLVALGVQCWQYTDLGFGPGDG